MEVTKKSETDMSHLIVDSDAIEKQPIAEIEIRPEEQSHISLGNYTSASPPKGFTIHVSPDPEQATIESRIIKLGTEKKYELVFHIANYGNKTVSTEVWQL